MHIVHKSSHVSMYIDSVISNSITNDNHMLKSIRCHSPALGDTSNGDILDSDIAAQISVMNNAFKNAQVPTWNPRCHIYLSYVVLVGTVS